MPPIATHTIYITYNYALSNNLPVYSFSISPVCINKIIIVTIHETAKKNGITLSLSTPTSHYYITQSKTHKKHNTLGTNDLSFFFSFSINMRVFFVCILHSPLQLRQAATVKQQRRYHMCCSLGSGRSILKNK